MHVYTSKSPHEHVKSPFIQKYTILHDSIQCVQMAPTEGVQAIARVQQRLRSRPLVFTLDLHQATHLLHWLRICYTGIGCGGAAGDVWANIGFTQPASNTRHDSGSSRFTLVSRMGAWTCLQVQVLDEVHLGCHSKQQASECMQTKGRRRRRLIPEWCHT
jgi:hypothetical protein